MALLSYLKLALINKFNIMQGSMCMSTFIYAHYTQVAYSGLKENQKVHG